MVLKIEILIHYMSEIATNWSHAKSFLISEYILVEQRKFNIFLELPKTRVFEMKRKWQ